MNKYESIKELYFSGNDVDSKGQAKLQRVLAFFEDIAEENAGKLGFGHNLLKEKGLAWVIIQYEIRVNNYPKIGKKYLLKSWPCNVQRAFSYRAYQIVDADDPENVLIEAMAAWVIMDAKNRALVIPDKVGINMPVCEDGDLFEIKKRKIREIQADIDINIRPVYSDYDINAHVNHSKYVEWICNVLPIEKVRDVGFESLNITYKKEVREGQPVILKIEDNKDECITVGVDEEGNRFFECIGKYRKG